MSETEPRAAALVARLRAHLDELDEQTRLPGEPPLREVVAEQARQRLAEMDDRPDPTVPSISWCRVFQVGPPCKHLCDDCARTYRASREATR